MPKVTIEVPERFEEVVKQWEQTLQRAQKGVEGAKGGACGTSRAADSTAQALGRLPYSRSCFEREGHAVGALYGSQRPRVEAALAPAWPAASEAHSVSLDRVSAPIEEPRPRPRGRPKQAAPKRPVSRAFRMAYVRTVTLHDKEGQALKTLRYGRMPQGDAKLLAQRMAQDVQAVLSQ